MCAAAWEPRSCAGTGRIGEHVGGKAAAASGHRLTGAELLCGRGGPSQHLPAGAARTPLAAEPPLPGGHPPEHPSTIHIGCTGPTGREEPRGRTQTGLGEAGKGMTARRQRAARSLCCDGRNQNGPPNSHVGPSLPRGWGLGEGRGREGGASGQSAPEKTPSVSASQEANPARCPACRQRALASRTLRNTCFSSPGLWGLWLQTEPTWTETT